VLIRNDHYHSKDVIPRNYSLLIITYDANNIIMKKRLLSLVSFTILICLLLFFGSNLINSAKTSPQSKADKLIHEKIYVAVEGNGEIAVIDASENKVIRKIDISTGEKGKTLVYAPHNVQVSPDGKTVWATVNYKSASHDHSTHIIPQAMAHESMDSTSDHVVIIDAESDRIVGRIPIGEDVHLAHIIVTPDNHFAYVTAQNENAIYKLDVIKNIILNKISLPLGSEPHGLRNSPDGRTIYVALMAGNAVGVIDVVTDSYSLIPITGTAVQTGVTPDGKYAFASVFDQKSVALINTESQELLYIPLNRNAKGPVQLFATPDSRYIYVADQGYYFDQPVSQYVYKIDIAKRAVVKEISTGKGPHGIVISQNGKYTYVTNLLSNDISVIDTTTDKEIKRIPVGKEPNGISYWSHDY
jgi:YVTN family beta-propeller protein